MKEAKFYTKLEEKKVQCLLCPHQCTINEEKKGVCRVRSNKDGILYSDNYGKVCSLGFDPIEKKPLYHFHPGKTIFSVGSVGCNLHCKFCQNWEISQTSIDDFPYLKNYTPEDIIRIAKKRPDNFGIAYTYNEPTVWYEFMFNISWIAKKEGLKNVIVSNGFIAEKPLTKLMGVIDAFSIDLKSFSEDFYKKLTSSRLEPVKETLKNIRKFNKHLEITNLVITDENDDENQFREMVNWIAAELGRETVFHISRYYPTYRLSNPPTSPETMENFYHIAREKLPYSYLGNVISNMGQNTYCHNCGEEVVKRSGYHTQTSQLNEDGSCKSCGNKIMVSD